MLSSGSCLIYAEAVPDQRVRHWTMAHRRALEYFSGVPERWIIDNLKAGVDKPDREAPRLNPSFRELAKHHNVAVLPARSGKATDKAKVEAAAGEDIHHPRSRQDGDRRGRAVVPPR